jgi:acyl transferase domain-containing protein
MAGGYLDDVAGFDAELFGIAKRDAAAMDPQHRLLLEAAWAAVQDAAFDPRLLAGARADVYVGLSSVDYSLLAHENSAHAGPYTALGGSKSLGANRISHALGLKGASLSVDSACSSALVCVHLAARSLSNGDCDLALAGGANAILTPVVNASFSRAKMLSKNGRCRSFQIAADGYLRSEGVGILVLKRLEDARRDKDPIRAIIVGSAVNQDGRTPGITVPSSEAQIDVISRAWAAGGITADDIDVIEAHGTGTPVGDLKELGALANLFAHRSTKRPPCLISSLKANIGHTEAAAGILSLIKVVRQLETGEVPPHAADGELIPTPAEAAGRLFFPNVRTRIPTYSDGPKHAGVSAFGFGGTNCHVVLRSNSEAERSAPAPLPVLFTLSAASQDALYVMAQDWADNLERHASKNPWWLADASRTSNAAFAGEHCRFWIVAQSWTEATRLLKRKDLPNLETADEPCRFLAGLGREWKAGAEIAFELAAVPGSRRIGEMPPYPFAHVPFWLPHLPCPKNVSVGDHIVEERYKQVTVDVSLASIQYVREHQIDHSVVAPGATLIDLVLSEACSRFGKDNYVIEDVVFHSPLILQESELVQVAVELRLICDNATSSEIAFEFWQPSSGRNRSEELIAAGRLTRAVEVLT